MQYSQRIRDTALCTISLKTVRFNYRVEYCFTVYIRKHAFSTPVWVPYGPYGIHALTVYTAV